MADMPAAAKADPNGFAGEVKRVSVNFPALTSIVDARKRPGGNLPRPWCSVTLRDRRDLLMDDLSKLGNISYAEDASGSQTVYLGTHELVVGTSARTINTVQDPANPGMVKLEFAIDNDAVSVSSGQLKGVLDARDVALPDLIEKLNTFASGLINSVNSIHQAGYGLDNTTGLAFFKGTELILELLGHRSDPSTVKFQIPAGWKLMTALKDTSDPMVFTAADYDTLVDAPALMGKFDVTQFEVEGKPHYF